MHALRVGSRVCLFVLALVACGNSDDGIAAAESCEVLAERATPLIENNLGALISEVNSLDINELDSFTPEDSDAFSDFQANAQKLDDRSREIGCESRSLEIACAAARSVDRSNRTATIILDALITDC